MRDADHALPEILHTFASGDVPPELLDVDSVDVALILDRDALRRVRKVHARDETPGSQGSGISWSSAAVT